MQVLMEQKIGKIYADRRNARAARKGSDRLKGQHRGPCRWKAEWDEGKQ